ncbi:uncharacterized protein LOC124352491 [Daphnia pulicaria]|uniref:uncharacterized protein LOC124352491 n=1 Tax=Daphnia pulicaria TaxID=35523 RepID=UPI001EECB6C8|nr:uncharacterized protein LOC124352491 [Daphnia pulicaria]
MDTGQDDCRLPLLNGSPPSKTAIFCAINPLQTPTNDEETSSTLPTELELKPRTVKQTYSLCENLAIDDLKKLQDWLLLQIYNTSDTLVGLLQERQQLSEEAHVRLISIEQLHRLLEARCFYRGLSTGLFS